jgi:4,5-dihydroxyphthalate decarboxylase
MEWSSSDDEAVEVWGGDYLHTLDLGGLHGGIEVRYRPVPVEEAFARAMAPEGVDAAEFSLAAHCLLNDAAEGRYVALPVFPYRAFRHHVFHCRQDSPLRGLDQVAGARVAVPDYSMTAAVWARGLLADEYGIRDTDVRWSVAGAQRFPVPERLGISRLESAAEQACLAGQVDVLLTPVVPEHDRPVGQRALRPLLPDPVVEELAYARRTGIYPINHVVVVRRDLLARRPAVSVAIRSAYERARAATDARPALLLGTPWGRDGFERLRSALDADPLQTGITELNARTLGTFFRYLVVQGLVSTMPRLGRLFDLSTD